MQILEVFPDFSFIVPSFSNFVVQKRQYRIHKIMFYIEYLIYHVLDAVCLQLVYNGLFLFLFLYNKPIIGFGHNILFTLAFSQDVNNV